MGNVPAKRRKRTRVNRTENINKTRKGEYQKGTNEREGKNIN